MHSNEDVLAWRGRDVVDRDGDSIGSLEEIYLDAETDEPTWAAVKTGMFGSRSTFVPIRGAELDGDRVRLAHEKAHIKDAPNVESDGELSPAEEDRLYDHYGEATGVSAGHAPDAAETGARRSDVTDPDRRTDADAPADTETETDTGAVTRVPSADERASEPAPTGGTGGMQDAPSTSSEGRRPRIRRFITEEVDEAGQITKRETRTEETFS